MDGQVNLDGYERSPHKIFCSKKKDPIVFFSFLLVNQALSKSRARACIFAIEN